MILSNAAIKNRTTVGVLVVLIAIMGAYSYVTLPRESEPDVKIPYVFVTTPYEGVSPEDIETSVTIKIEKELGGLKGVKEISSASSEGLSLIMIEFLSSVKIDDALQYVRDKVDLAKAELHADVEEPVIIEVSIAEMPIMTINISGPISIVRLKAIADQLEDVIEGKVPGVLNVDVVGDREREIRLEVDQDMVASYGLTVSELLRLVPSENVNISAGSLETPGMKFNIRVPAEFVQPEEVEHLLLTVRDGKPIYLCDVARVRDTFKDRASFARLDGVQSVSLNVQKRVGADILPIAAAVEKILAEARRRAPSGVEFRVTADRSDDIRLMVSDLENNILTGLVFVVLVLLLFLGWRTSLIVALAIPMSMLISFTMIQAVGMTLNMVVLFSLILALGMLVDNAIVIVENIYRYTELGHDRLHAAMKGTAEVAWPVITSTATTIAAFAPLLFWPGIMGEFMKYLPMTLIITLGSSLFVAMIISPTVCSVISKVSAKRVERGPGLFVRAYSRLLRLALNHRIATVALALLLLVGMCTLYGKLNYGVELFPEGDPNFCFVNIRCPQGTNIIETDALALECERRVDETIREDLKYVVTNVGSSGGFSMQASAGGPHLAHLTLTFKDFKDRKRESADAIKQLRGALSRIPGAEIKVEEADEGPPTGAPVEVRVIGENFGELVRISERVKRIILSVPGVINVRSDFEAARPELAFRVDRQKAMLLGVNTAVVGNFLKTAVFGYNVGTYRQFNDEYDITVRLPEDQRTRIDDLLRLRVPNASGQAVPLSSLGSFSYAGGFGTIRRIDQKRVITISADNVKSIGSDEVLKNVQEALSPLGRRALARRDILDWPGLCRALAGGAGAGQDLAGRLGGKLDRKTADLVRSAVAGAELDQRGRDNILAAINKTLGEAKLCAGLGIADKDLPPWGQELRGHNVEDLTESQVRALNRMCIESAMPDLVAPAERLVLADGYELQYAGEKEEQDKAQAFLTRAFLIAMLIIVMILVTQFNTLSAPLIIMTTVALSMIGVTAGLMIFQMPFGVVMTGVGVISLAGVVVNNAIVLLDYTRRLQRKGRDVVAAAIEAGVTRLRPVLLTAMTTILGLLPMVTGVSFDFRAFELVTKSESAQWWQSMAVVVVFGLAFATILTLVVVPALYVGLYRTAKWFGMGGLRRPGGEADTGPELADF